MRPLLIVLCVIICCAYGQQPVFLMTGQHTDGSHVFVRAFGDPKTTWYQKILEDKEFSTTQVAFDSAQLELHAIASDYQSQRAYIFDSINPFIRYVDVPLDPTGRTTIYRLSIPVSRKVLGLAVDWVSRNLYWTDATYNWIGMTPLNAEDKYKFIVTQKLFGPHGIGVHPKTSSLFWADSESGLVERSDLKGGNRRTFIPNDGNMPSALIVDGDRVYWQSTHFLSGKINSIGVDGNDRRVEVSDTFTLGLVAFDVYKNLIFTTTSTRPFIYDGGNKNSYDVEDFAEYNGLAMHAQAKQPAMDSSCDGSCQTFCIGTNNNQEAECLCSHFEDENEIGKCISSPEVFYPTYIYHNTTGIYRQSVWATERYVPPVEVLTTRDIKTFDLDHKNRRIYYVEGNLIHSVNLIDGSKSRAIVQNPVKDGDITGIAVDWINDEIYWATTNFILMSTIDGNNVYTLHNGRDNSMGDIVVHPGLKQIFWIENGATQSIFSSNLDGSGISTFISSDTGHPTKLHIDYTRNRLYWTDRVQNTVESINFDRSDRKTHTFLPTPYGVAVFGDHVAWTSSQGLFWAFKDTDIATSLESSIKHLRDVKVYWETGFPDFKPKPSTPMTTPSTTTPTTASTTSSTKSTIVATTNPVTISTPAGTKSIIAPTGDVTTSGIAGTTVAPNSTETPGGGPNSSVIAVAAGASVGGLCLIAVVIAVICCLMNRKNRPEILTEEPYYETPRDVGIVPHDYAKPVEETTLNRFGTPARTGYAGGVSAYANSVYVYDDIKSY